MAGERDSFEFLSGRDVLREYRSSEAATRSFRGTCGSPLLFESSRWPGEISVALPQVTGHHTARVRAHIYYDDRVPWVQLADELPRQGQPV
jgi:hypothetical protein